MKLNPRFLFIFAFLLIILSVTICFKADNADFASDREIIVMRNIGHEILLSSGDSSSRVLPVIKTEKNHYQIRFESNLQFSTDSIVRIIRQAVHANRLPSDYIVNVVDCYTNQVVYGFAILKTEQTNLVACKGRKQPKACYSIKISFGETAFNTINKDYFAGAGSGLAALMLIFSGLRINQKQKRTIHKTVDPVLLPSEVIQIGDYKFHRDNQYLEYKNEQVALSDKEAKVLCILASKLNELVERPELQKVWDDEGVIVGRSLDMFISKLRKKLENDTKVKLVNVHGKGYKLESS